MAKFLLFTALFLLITACEQNCQEQSQTKDLAKNRQSNSACMPAPTPEPGPLPESESLPEADVPGEALLFGANVTFTDFEREQEGKVYEAIEIIKKVVTSSEFRNRVINFSYKGKKQFVGNKGLNNEEIYRKLLEGREDLIPEIDHEMDLDLKLYYSWRNTVGHTYPNTLRIWMNTKFFNVYSPTEVAGNIFHEWIHKLGFEHAVSYSVERDSSVPYALGYLIRDLGKQYE